MSPYLAASTSIEPSMAFTSRPSIVSWIVFCSGRGIVLVDGHRASVLVGHAQRNDILQVAGAGPQPRSFDLSLQLRAELLDHRADRHGHGFSQHAQAVADDLLLDGGHDVQ